MNKCINTAWLAKLWTFLGERLANKADDTFYVCSEEPVSKELIWRGPFGRKDAMTLIAVNSACGSIDHLYQDVNGMLIPQ